GAAVVDGAVAVVVDVIEARVVRGGQRRAGACAPRRHRAARVAGLRAAVAGADALGAARSVVAAARLAGVADAAVVDVAAARVVHAVAAVRLGRAGAGARSPRAVHAHRHAPVARAEAGLRRLAGVAPLPRAVGARAVLVDEAVAVAVESVAADLAA